MKIKKGDKIKIIKGKDQGKTGTVDRVFGKENQVLVSGLNLFKKHVKPQGGQKRESGGIVDISRPLAIEKVALICPKCSKPTRVGYSLAGKEKIRICKKCKSQI